MIPRKSAETRSYFGARSRSGSAGNNILVQKDKISKDMTLNEAQAYNDDPLSFAKKCIMLLEAIRKHMGPVDLN